jgi:Beta/Gamma crystallin
MGEIVLYADANFGGLHTHLFQTTPDFTQLSLIGGNLGLLDGVSWNDQVSSFVIVSGAWLFFADVEFGSPQGDELGPGLYPWVVDVKIANDALSSIQLVSG